jgi:hypothetical protein
MADESERRTRALARLAELDDEPGGDQFLARMGVPWIDIEQAILQVTPYAGIPRAVNAIKVLREQQEAAT